MRSSFLSRSVIAAASLAIGSAALAATPANAASTSGITRDMVLTATAGVRAAANTDDGWSFATGRAIDRIVSRACGMEFDSENHLDGVQANPVTAGNVDGIFLSANVHEYNDAGEGSRRQCTFAVLTTTDTNFVLSGNASVSVTSQPYSESEVVLPLATTTATPTLAGDVFVTGPIMTPEATAVVTAASFSAAGNATRPFTVTTQQKVATPKSKAAKKAAKKSYSKKLKSAKKAYTKAIDKAGKNKSKKAAAKKAYAAKRAAAKTAYDAAVATSKVITVTTPQAENRPFSVNAALQPSNDL